MGRICKHKEQVLLKFDANAQANVDVDAKYERTFTVRSFQAFERILDFFSRICRSLDRCAQSHAEFLPCAVITTMTFILLNLQKIYRIYDTPFINY